MLRSLRARTAAIVILGVVLSNLIGYILYSFDRRESLLLADAFDGIERAASVSRLLRDLSANWENDIVTALDSRTFRVWKSEAPPFTRSGTSEEEDELTEYFKTLTPRISSHPLRVWLRRTLPVELVVPDRPDIDVPSVVRSGAGRWYLVIGIDHGGGHWLNFLTQLTPSAVSLPVILILNLLVAAFGLGIAAIWLVARVTSPLFQMAQAASELGTNLRARPLPEDGPHEVAVAARAFNQMQRRLIRYVEGRTTLLAAISHDLRTPITQMRLRTELMPPSEDREKTLSALDEMNTIIGTFLDYSRASQDDEVGSGVDLGSLIETICEDFADAGHHVECSVHNRVAVKCKRVALKRALVNIVENAVFYGGSAQVSLKSTPLGAEITIEDSGPGIREDRLPHVFEPFFRLEIARSTRHEGMGLGLSIALMIVEDHGGTIALSNKVSGGLKVVVRLPQKLHQAL